MDARDIKGKVSRDNRVRTWGRMLVVDSSQWLCLKWYTHCSFWRFPFRFNSVLILPFKFLSSWFLCEFSGLSDAIHRCDPKEFQPPPTLGTIRQIDRSFSGRTKQMTRTHASLIERQKVFTTRTLIVALITYIYGPVRFLSCPSHSLSAPKCCKTGKYKGNSTPKACLSAGLVLVVYVCLCSLLEVG